MRTSRFLMVVLMLALTLAGVGFLAKQRSQLQALRTELASQVPYDPLEASDAESNRRVPALPAGGTEGKKRVVPTLMAAEKRSGFLRQMQGLIETHGSGMSTFTPDEAYVQSLGRMSVDDLLATLGDLEHSRIAGRDKHQMTRNLLYRLARLAPERALERAHDGGATTWKSVVRASIERLSRTDPDAARQWLEKAEWGRNADYRNEVSSLHAVGLAAGGEVEAALETLEELEGPNELAFKRVALAATGAEERALVCERVSGEAQWGVRAAMVRGALYRGGFEAARTVFAEQFMDSPDDVRSQALVEVASETFDDGGVPEVLDWVMNESPEEDRIHNLKGLVGEWVRRDYNAAARWIGGLSGEDKKAAIAVLVEMVRVFDPEGAAMWEREANR
ncbi:MAG: hypothetical protein AAF514_06245 [Verrucomicrobiota bacterium]